MEAQQLAIKRKQEELEGELRLERNKSAKLAEELEQARSLAETRRSGLEGSETTNFSGPATSDANSSGTDAQQLAMRRKQDELNEELKRERSRSEKLIEELERMRELAVNRRPDQGITENSLSSPTEDIPTPREANPCSAQLPVTQQSTARRSISELESGLELERNRTARLTEELEQTRALAETRRLELTGSESYMRKADRLSARDVKDMVERLNDEIYQVAASIAEEVIEKVPATREEMKSAYIVLSSSMGTEISDLLRTQLGADEMFTLGIALQAAVMHCVRKMVCCWDFDYQPADRHMSQLYALIHAKGFCSSSYFSAKLTCWLKQRTNPSPVAGERSLGPRFTTSDTRAHIYRPNSQTALSISLSIS